MSRFLPRFGAKLRRKRTVAGIVCIALALAAGVAAAVFVVSVRVPDALLHSTAPPDTVTLLDSRGEPLAELANADARSHHQIALADMGPDLPRLTVALEDRRFHDHRGIDFRALFAAAARDLRARRIVSGASTITEQLVKLASTPQSRHRTLPAKAREAVAAWKLEHVWTKKRILARYLNAAASGPMSRLP